MALVATLRRAHLRPTVSEREILQSGTPEEQLDVAVKIVVEGVLPIGAVKSTKYKRDVGFELGRPD